MSLLSDFDQALANVPGDSRDLATVTLARMICRTLDTEPELLSQLAPKLTALLRELGMTPRSRGKAVTVDDQPDATEDEFVQIVAGLARDH